MLSTHQLIEGFKVENEYEYENCARSQKIKDTQESFSLPFFTKKGSTVISTEGC